MNRQTLWMGAAVLVLAAGCNRDDRTSIGASNNDRDRQASITVTGCLQAGEQGLASREPNAASRSAEGVDRFVLASPTSASAPLYILEGKAEELRTHVGHQVEITGKPDDNRSSNPDPNQPGGQRLDVESVRMIAQTCAAR
jgi:hypothetical protein